MGSFLVTFPANTKARITGVKSTEEISTLKDAERVLRDSGFSKQDALAFVSRVKTYRVGVIPTTWGTEISP